MTTTQFRSISKQETPLRLRKEKENEDQHEIGKQGIWLLSSAKPGFGIEQLCDNSLESYWQSDGPQPHLINIIFQKKLVVNEIEIFINYKADESYTPSQIGIKIGTHFQDLQEVKTVDIPKITGWLSIPLTHPKRPNHVVRTNFIQVLLLSNHQNGRDSHLRQVKIYGPKPKQTPFLHDLPNCKTDDFFIYSNIK